LRLIGDEDGLARPSPVRGGAHEAVGAIGSADASTLYAREVGHDAVLARLGPLVRSVGRMMVQSRPEAFTSASCLFLSA
jgi:hypothetical protein